MDTKQILTADVLDIIFDGKNKAYGAYELRKTYNKRILTALISTAVIIVIFYSGTLMSKNDDQQMGALVVDTVTLIKIPEEKIEPPKVIPPKIQEPIPVRQIAVATPRIVPDEKVRPDEMPPLQEDIQDAKIALTTSDGVDDPNLTAPPINADGKGIIEAPKKEKENDDYRFIPVEIEAQYPGGLSAWTRFLIKTLNDYPEEALEKNVQGTVEVKFIVNKEGEVSDVQVASGPQELREAAIKAIRKSGKWVPARQNGRPVITYKKQPITFRLSE